jgi:hypothetical protein
VSSLRLAAWRRVAVPRKRQLPDAAAVRRGVNSMFWGVPVEVISRWCCVSHTTARLYKTGVRKPSRSSMALFVLHSSGRVLEDKWWRGWRVHQQHLIRPQGRPLSQSQLSAFELVHQLAAEFARKDLECRQRLDQIQRSV